MARAGQHARPSHKHCKACAKHAHAPRPRVHTGLHDFHLVEFSYQPVPSQSKLRVETTGVTVTEQPHYPKLRVAWHGLSNTRARRTNTAKRAPNMPMHHGHVSIPVCVISILWNFHINPYHPSKNYELKQQGDGAGETSRTTNYELHGTGRATRAPVAQTLQSVRQTCLCTTATCPYQFARFPSSGRFSN
jgi:hypothetical protein